MVARPAPRRHRPTAAIQGLGIGWGARPDDRGAECFPAPLADSPFLTVPMMKGLLAMFSWWRRVPTRPRSQRGTLRHRAFLLELRNSQGNHTGGFGVCRWLLRVWL